MKILVYSNCPLDPALGSGKTRVRFSGGLRVRGHEVRVVPPDEFEFLPRVRAGRRFRLAWGARRHARRVLAAEAWDVVEINGGEFGWLARGLQPRRRRPLLVHRTDGCELLAEPVPSRGFRRAGQRLHRALDEAAFRCVDASVTLSGADAAHLRTAGFAATERTRVVPPGLDDEYLAYPAPEDRAPRIAFTGSWIARKGVDVLVAAAGPLLRAHPEVELDLLGTGAAPAAVLAQFPAEVRARIHVADRLATAELAARLAQAGIFVLPTRYEGYGMATAEAMACGCAVVTTPTGFGADLRSGEEALVVPRDSVTELHDALGRLVMDAALRRRLAARGWRRVQSHRWSESVAALEAAYLGWLGAPR